MSEFLLVAAIDFGTTFSGYAFSFRHDYERDPLKIQANTAWTTAEGQAMLSLKTPTTVLLKPDQTFHSFGYEAEDKYCELAEQNEHRDWFFYKRFKMLLHNKQALKRDTEIPDATGKMMPAKTIFTMAIQYIKDHLLRTINKRGLEVRADEILWVLTVPAIWDEPAKQFMREAATAAGISSKHLRLALEPEAASVYCKSIPLERQDGEGDEGARLGLFSPDTRYLVLDIGGGTVDVTVHEVRQDGTLKELYKASGGAWGGTMVDTSYFDLFNKLFGKEFMDKFKLENMFDDLEMQRDFEMKKRTVKTDSERVVMHISAAFNEFVRVSTDASPQDIVNRDGLGEKIVFKRDRMVFNGEIVREMFKSSITSIIEHVQKVISSLKVKKIDKILMVGGFSECSLVTEAVKTAFPDVHVIAPYDPGLAVLKGAVIFGHSPMQISSRVVRYTYGVAALGPFIKGQHPEDKLVRVNSEEFCTDLFSKLIEVDADVGDAESIEKIYDIVDPARPMEIAIYVSRKAYPIFVTEEGCTRLGEIIINVPVGGWRKNASLKVQLGFGGTEFTVTATELQTQIQQEAKFDFLS